MYLPYSFSLIVKLNPNATKKDGSSDPCFVIVKGNNKQF